MQYTPILTMPASKDPFFLAKSAGGLNPGIPRPSGSRLHFANCVFFGIGAYAKHWGVWLPSTNAENLYSAAQKMGLPVSQTPQLGALIVWAAGAVGNGSDGAGHVGSVEKINADGSIVTAESGWNASKAFWTTTRKRGSDGNWGQRSSYRFLGFVLPPDAVACPYRTPTKAILRGSTGEEVRWLQWQLIRAGTLDEDELDGDFGARTERALVYFQYLHKLDVDGICGPKTRAKLLS